MKTEFAKAIEAGEDVVGKEIICVNDNGWEGWFDTESTYKVLYVVFPNTVGVSNGRAILSRYLSDFEFKSVIGKDTCKVSSDELCQWVVDFVKEASEENKRLKEQLDGTIEVNKQYEQQLFDLRMENARLELAAQRWEMFNSPVNREIADKLLKKLADEAVETR